MIIILHDSRCRSQHFESPRPTCTDTGRTRAGLPFAAVEDPGVPLVDVVWEDTRPSDHPDAVKGLITFIQGFDAEISVGYCF